MHNKRFSQLLMIICILLFATSAHAKVSKEFKKLFEERFTPAIPHRGLITAAEDLEMGKLKTFVIVERDRAIPADRAFYLITPQEYDYRGSVIKDGVLKTRGGSVYAYVPKGEIMAVSDVVFSGRTIYLKLLSIKIVPSKLHPKQKPTRVAAMLGFMFDKETLKDENIGTVFSTIEQWVKPFGSYKDALKYDVKVEDEINP